jgi:hypothetical protein
MTHDVNIVKLLDDVEIDYWHNDKNSSRSFQL